MKNEFNSTKFLDKDINLLKKYEIDPTYFDKLYVAVNVAKDLKIVGKIQFIAYQMHLKQLEGIEFDDIEAYIRLENPDRYQFVKEQYEKKLEKEKKDKSNIIPFRK